jgi:MFS family permease
MSTVAATTPPAEQADHPHATPAIVFLGLVAGLQLVDPAVANTAIVAAGKDLGMTGSTLALAASISTLALAATVLPFGVAADRLGRRRVMMVALVLAIVGDLIVALSPVTSGYMLGRAIAGVGVGAALAAAFAYVRFVAGTKDLASALGLWNLAMVLTFMTGAVTGGYLANHNWRLAMLLVPVLAAVALVLTPLLLRPMPRTVGGSIDYAGMTVIATAMVAFLYGVSQATHGWRTPQFLIPTLAGLILFAAYFVIERAVDHPIFPPALFLKGAFLAAVVAGIGWNFAQAVMQLQTSNFWQYVQGYTTMRVALSQLLFMVSFGVAGFVVGKLIRPGDRMIWLIGGGFGILTVTFVLFSFVGAGTGYGVMAPMLFLGGIGVALVSVPQSAIFVAQAPPRYLGPVTSFRTTAGQLGYAMGFAMSAALINMFGRLSLVDSLKALGVPPQETGGAVGQVLYYIHSKQHPDNPTIRDALARLSHDYAAGFNAMMFLVAILMFLVGVIVVLLLLLGRHQDGEGAEPAADGEGSGS